jgi:hypothetical protein
MIQQKRDIHTPHLARSHHGSAVLDSMTLKEHTATCSTGTSLRYQSLDDTLNCMVWLMPAPVTTTTATHHPPTYPVYVRCLPVDCAAKHHDGNAALSHSHWQC